MSDLSEIAVKLGDELHKVCSEQKGCEELCLEWAVNRYMYLEVEKRISKFKEIVSKLKDLECTSQDNGIWYGDADVYAWIEEDKYLILRNVVTCRDDNIFVYSLRDFGDEDLLTSFLCQTFWENEVREYKTATFNDHRDIKYPSLETLRKCNYDFGYKDTRDKGFGFELKHNKTEGGLSHFINVSSALKELDYAFYAISENEFEQ